MSLSQYVRNYLKKALGSRTAADELADAVDAVPAAGLPTGGTDGQVLTKTSSTDYATAWEDAGGGGGGVSSVTVTLTNAQFKALRSTPVTIVPAPGAGKVIVPLQAVLYAQFGTPYDDDATNNHDLRFMIGSNGPFFKLANHDDWDSLLSKLLLGTRDLFMISPLFGISINAQENDAYGGFLAADLANAALTITSNVGADFTSGDAANSLKVTVYFSTLTL